MGIFSTLLALVLAAGCMPTALAETVSMQEERAGTGVVGATVEMAVEVAAEPEVAAQSASVSAPRACGFVHEVRPGVDMGLRVVWRLPAD